ncbi:MAG: PIN domain-containing protein [Gluconacetobacter diazotrophicus]|nr:PIN domain-containing protein [Gluconacetobacter diazotrophicus]
MLLDTNVVLYALLEDGEKSPRARAALAVGGHVSVQTLNETTHVLRKRKVALDDVERFIHAVKALVDVLPVTAEVYDAGWRIVRRYGLSTYDAMIVGCAYANGIDTVLSEDMQHGLAVFDSVTVRNPFREALG